MSKKKIYEVTFAFGGAIDRSLTASCTRAMWKIDNFNKTANKTEIPKQLTRAWNKHFKDFSKNANNVGKSIKGIGKAWLTPYKMIGTYAAATTTALFAIANSTAKAGDDAIKTSRKLGISTEAYLKLAYAAEQSGSSQEGLSTAMRFLNKSIIQTASGNKELNLYFQKMGIAVRDVNGNVRSTEDIFVELSDVFAKIPSDIGKVNLATKLFGRSGAEMIPLLEQGKDAIKDYGDMAVRLGLTEYSADSTRFRDNLTELQGAFRGVRNIIGNAVIPIFADFMKKISDFIVANRELLKLKVADFIGAMVGLLPDLKNILVSVVNAVRSFATSIQAWIEKQGGLENAIRKAWKMLSTFKNVLLALKFGGFVIAFAKLIKSFSVFLGLLKVMIPVIKALAIAFGIVGIKIIVVVAIIGAIIFAIVKLEKRFKVFSNLFKSIGNFFKNEFLAIRDAFREGFVKGIITLIARFITYPVRLFITMWSSILSSTKDGWNAIWDWLKGAFFKVIDFFIGWISDVVNLFKHDFWGGVVYVLTRLFNPFILINDAINRIWDIDLLKMGKEWFGNFIKGVLKELGQLHKIIGDTLGSLNPFGKKNKSSSINIPAFANGGIVNSPQLAMIGESGPEAIIPLNNPNRAQEIMQKTGLTTNNNSSFVFSPVININGNADTNTVQTSIADLKRQFENWYKEKNNNQRRVALV